MICRLLVAVDGTAHAEAAALAIDWGRRFGSELVGLGIYDELSISPGEAVPLGASASRHPRDFSGSGDCGRASSSWAPTAAIRSATSSSPR